MASRSTTDLRARWAVGRLLAAGYVLALLALVVIAASAYRELARARASSVPVGTVANIATHGQAKRASSQVPSV